MILPKYRVTQRVYIPAIDEEAIIRSIIIDVMGISYRVTYWCNSKHESVELFEDEISEGK